MGWLIQTFNQNSIVVEVSNLVASNKKSAIHVLHVDDDACHLEVSKDILMDMGSFEIDHACCVDEAFKKLSVSNYDVVVSDYEMPKKNGLQFLKELREQKNNISFILFTGKGREEVAIHALNLGADAYHNKQGSPETVYGELAHAINQAVKRAKAKSALELAEFKFRTVADSAYDWVYWMASDGSFVYMSPSCERITGYCAEEFIKDPQLLHRIVAPQDIAIVNSHFDLFKSEKEHIAEFRIITKSGKTRWISHVCQAVVTDKGEWLGRRVTNQDISERMKAEEEILSLAKFPFEDANPVLRIAKDGTVLYANPVAVSLLRELKVEVGQPAPPKLFRLVADAFSSGLKKEGEMEYGDQIFLLTLSPVAEAAYVNVYGLDITERKKTEEALRESEERFRTIFEGASEGILIADIKTKRFVFANSAMSELVGYSLKELCMLGVADIHLKEDLPYVVDEFTKLSEGKVLASDIPVLRKDGKVVYCDVTSAVSRFGKNECLVGFFRDISERKSAVETLESRERRYREFAESLPEIVFETDDKGMPTFLNKKAFEIMGYSNDEIRQMNILQFLVLEDRQRARENLQRRMHGEQTVGNEYTLLRKDGATFPGIIFTEKIVTQEGKPHGLRGVIVNISQTKKVEEDLLVLTEKLRVVGSLTRHDVGNKLMTAKSNLYLLKKQLSDRPELAKYFDGIDAAFASSDEMFEFSHLYEKIGVEKPSKENVAQCFSQAVALLRNLGTVKVVNECRGLEVVADSLLKVLFYNLVDNSLRHGEKVTKIRLHFSEDGDGVKLFYEDDGVGAPDANKPKLFEVGFTTGKGSGLGLYLVKKMMDVYGWQIQETGEPGKGVKFTIDIPRINQNGKENFQITS